MIFIEQKYFEPHIENAFLIDTSWRCLTLIV